MKRKRLIVGVDARVANETVRAGVGNYCYEVLKALAPLCGDLILRLYLDRFPLPHFPVSNVGAEIRVLERRRGWSQRVLGRELRRNPPDIFFAPTTQIPLLIPCPVVATMHDLAFFEFGEYFTRSTRFRSRMQARYAARRASHFFAISNATKQDMIRRFGLSPEAVTVTHMGVSERFRPCDDPRRLEQLRATHDLPQRYILYVGRLQPRKNIERLIDAFAKVRTRRPNLPHHLVIAGDRGWMYERVYARAEASSAAPFITFPGFVPETDLPTLMSGADALALVSLWEGFGMPVAEAMACGTAVLTSNCSSLPEVIGDAGLTVDPWDVTAIADALELMLTDDALRHKLEIKGLERATQFTWVDAAQKTHDALLRLTSQV